METWSWPMGLVTLEVRVGDLLAAPEVAIVNPENSGFELAAGGYSVSAQLARRYPGLQAALDAQTGGKCLPEGSVLMTPVSVERIIFHAGHHHPQNWLGWHSDVTEDAVAAHLALIARCSADILGRVEALGLGAVAFPFIGSGDFGLSIESVAEVLFQAVADFARRAARPTRVVLVLWDGEDLERVVRSGTRVLASMVGGGRPLLSQAGGHPVLSELRKGVRSGVDPVLQEQRLLGFAEVGLHLDLALLLELRGRSPEDIMAGVDPRRGGFHFSFGFISSRLEAETAAGASGLPAWLAARTRWLAKSSSRAAIRRLKEDRNRLAHKGAPRELSALIEDVEQLFGPAALPADWEPLVGARWLADRSGELALADGLNLATSQIFWLLPVSRARDATPLGPAMTASS